MLISALATAGKIAGVVYSKYKQNQLNNAADAAELEDYKNTDRILQSNLRSDYTSRTDFQNILTRQKALLDAQWKRQQGANAVAGSVGGLEAGAAQKQANALAMADTMGNLAAGASDYKDSVQQQIIANNARHTQNVIASKRRQANDVAGAAAGVQSAMNGIIGLDNPVYDASALRMFGLTKQADNLLSDYEKVK